MENLKGVMAEFFDQLKIIYEKKESLNFVKSKFKNLNDVIVGFYYGEVTVIGSRTGMGKTTLAINLIMDMCLNQDKSILFFNLETSKKKLFRKFLSLESEVNFYNIENGNLSDEDWGRIGLATSSLGEAKITIDDQNGVTIYDIKEKIIKYKEENKLDVVVIDYIQLIEGGELYKGNRQQEISEITKEVKKLAKELNIIVIILSQTGRSSEQRADRRPMLLDLKESSSIEEDADNVLLLYRDDYYDDESPLKGILEVIVGKQKSGSTGTVLLTLNNGFFRLKDYEGSLCSYWNID